MKKIKSLFKRDYEGTRLVLDEVLEGSEWVINGDGKPTRKWDGTSCMIKDGILYKRYDVKKGKSKPVNGIPCELKPNEHTGHWPWWVPIGEGNEDKWHREAWDNLEKRDNGTYELIGPKINGNKDGWDRHTLIPHGYGMLSEEPPRNFDGLKEYFSRVNIEGIVWHHPDGRMVKIKKKDFGYKWKGVGVSIKSN